jgi:hypothetical protein
LLDICGTARPFNGVHFVGVVPLSNRRDCGPVLLHKQRFQRFFPRGWGEMRVAFDCAQPRLFDLRLELMLRKLRATYADASLWMTAENKDKGKGKANARSFAAGLAPGSSLSLAAHRTCDARFRPGNLVG